jgi:hypothetical protein
MNDLNYYQILMKTLLCQMTNQTTFRKEKLLLIAINKSWITVAKYLAILHYVLIIDGFVEWFRL